MSKAETSRRPWYVWAGLILITFAVAVGVLWLARKPLAEAAVHRYCGQRDLACSVSIEDLSLSSLKVTDLRVGGAAGAAPLEIETLDAALSWPGLFKPAVTTVIVDRPVIRLAYENGALDWRGLDRLLGSGTGEGAAPRVELGRGEVQIETGAGTVRAAFDLQASWPEAGKATVIFDPADLARGEDALTLNQGRLVLELSDEAISGDLALNLSDVQLGEVRVDAFELAMVLDDPGTRALTWTGELSGFTQPGLASTARLDAEGVLQLRPTAKAGASSLVDAWLEAAQASASASDIRIADAQTSTADLEIDLVAKPNGGFDLAARATANGLVSPTLTGNGVDLSFDGSLGDALFPILGTGDAAIRQAALTPDTRAAFTAGVDSPAPFEAHARVLRQTTNNALAAFSTSARFRFEAESGSQFQITLPDDLTLEATSGLRLDLTAETTRPVLIYQPGRLSLMGLLKVRGGGAPDFAVDVKSLAVSDRAILLDAGGLSLKPWRAGTSVFSADLNRLELKSGADGIHAAGIGEIGVSGDILGFTLAPSRLFGGVEAVRADSGWRVQMLERDCFGLNFGGAAISGEFSLAASVLRLCPEQGRLIRVVNGRPSGILNLGDVSLPFSGRTLSGQLDLSETRISWRGTRDFSAEISADSVSMPMLIADRTLRLDGNAPNASLSSSTSTLLAATLQDTVFSGTLIPANVRVDELIFDASVEDSGLTGLARADSVRIYDLREDPLYQPLVASLTAQFAGTQMQMTGPVRIEGRTPVIADTRLDLDLRTLTGAADLISKPLLFTSGGLQPKHLSDRLRDVMSNARGEVNARGNIAITRAKLSGTGRMDIVGLGFDTLRIGAVDGVAGTVEFENLLNLTTKPGQTVTIARIDPGLPLENGEVTFRLEGGRSAYIEEAIWPFAGGSLSVAPSLWTVGGKTDTITVEASEIELTRLVEVLTLPNIVAEGTISGSFPIELSEGNVYIRDAELEADEKGGTLRYTGAISEQAASADPRVNFAFQALRDFRFKVLKVGVDGNLIGDIVLSLKLLGANPDVLDGAEFDFNISIDSKLAQLIRSGRSAMSTNWLTEAIAEPSGDTPD